MRIKILILKGKHNTSHFNVTTPSLHRGACLQIIKENNEMGYYFDDDKELAEKILSENDGKAAYSFVIKRSDHEYEEIHTETLQEYEN